MKDIKKLIKNSFLSRVPELLKQGFDFEVAVTMAYNQEQSFLTEIREGNTRRSQIIRKQLCEKVYQELKG